MSSSQFNYYDKYLKKFNIPNNNMEVFFLFLILLFSVFTRVMPFSIITILTVTTFLFLLGIDFYFYINKCARDENKNKKTIEFSWGYIKEKNELSDYKSIYKYLSHKDFAFFKNYFLINVNKGILILFIFGDIIVAFKNLDLYNSGIYIAMSLFTKFVFIAYVFMRQSFNKFLIGEKNTEENILEIFYTQINSMLSIFAVLFIFFFMLSKYICDIFFGKGYIPYQSSLPFILLANISLTVAICIYKTSYKIDQKTTAKISKIYLSIVFLLFVFMDINYIDTITYFIIGSSTLISIFLYNFVIKKPEYIRSTYNHLL